MRNVLDPAPFSFVQLRAHVDHLARFEGNEIFKWRAAKDFQRSHSWKGTGRGAGLRVGRLHLIIGLAPRALIVQFATGGRARPLPPPPLISSPK